MTVSAKLARAGRTLVVRIPLPVQRRRTRKLIVGPDGAPWSLVLNSCSYRCQKQIGGRPGRVEELIDKFMPGGLGSIPVDKEAQRESQ
jgi:hypothetical protein